MTESTRITLFGEMDRIADALRENNSDLRESLSCELQIELAQKNMTVQNLRERIQQKYRVNLDEIHGECITITFPDEGPARVHVVSPDEVAARLGVDPATGLTAAQAAEQRAKDGPNALPEEKPKPGWRRPHRGSKGRRSSYLRRWCRSRRQWRHPSSCRTH